MANWATAHLTYTSGHIQFWTQIAPRICLYNLYLEALEYPLKLHSILIENLVQKCQISQVSQIQSWQSVHRPKEFWKIKVQYLATYVTQHVTLKTSQRHGKILQKIIYTLSITKIISLETANHFSFRENLITAWEEQLISFYIVPSGGK